MKIKWMHTVTHLKLFLAGVVHFRLIMGVVHSRLVTGGNPLPGTYGGSPI